MVHLPYAYVLSYGASRLEPLALHLSMAGKDYTIYIYIYIYVCIYIYIYIYIDGALAICICMLVRR